VELEDYNCWTIAEALGHSGPHILRHLLSRAVRDEREALELAGAWAARRLDDGEAVLIIDETADAKSSTDAAGAARQYSGTLGGIELCQVAVTLTFASSRGHALISRSLYLPEACAADGEHRELAGIPGDEVYEGRGVRRAIRERGMSYVLAVRANTTITPCPGTTVAVARAAEPIPGRGWQRLRTGSGSKGTRHYHWAGRQARLGDPLGRPRRQGPALVRLGMAGHHLPAPLPAHPPPPGHRRARLSLLLRPRQPARVAVPAGPRGRVPLAGGSGFPVREGLLRPGPVPGPLLPRDRPAHRAGHGRAGHLRRHRRPAAPPHRHPPTRPGPAGPAAARRAGNDPAHRPRDRAAAHPGTAAVELDRPATTVTDHPVDGPADRWRQRDQDDLAALPHMRSADGRAPTPGRQHPRR
jgi:hypothetical protein